MENRYERDDLQAALRVLREGGVILYPTDTVWGIGCDATNAEAVARVYAIKKRVDSKAMLVLLDGAGKLQGYLEHVPDTAWMLLEASEDPKKVNEAINFVLPRATKSEFVIGFTPEALIQFMHKRLCVRAQEFIHELAMQMRTEVHKLNPRFAKELQAQCQWLLWCPEGERCCGRKPTREKFVEKIENGMW